MSIRTLAFLSVEQAGATLAGCHVAGHYAGGMRATITVAG